MPSRVALCDAHSSLLLFQLRRHAPGLGSPLIERIPLASLVGVMFMVVIGTFEWSSLRTFGRVPFSEILVILSVTLVTVFLHNLALAVFAGIILSALVFAWESSKHVFVNLESDTGSERHYSVQGLIYFGSVSNFTEHFQCRSQAETIIIDMAHARVCDMSGIEALNALAERYRKGGKTLHVRHLPVDCRRMLKRAGSMLHVEIMPDDPEYIVAKFRMGTD